MIRSEQEYYRTKGILLREQDGFDRYTKAVEALGCSPEQVKKATDPWKSFLAGLQEELVAYEAENPKIRSTT